MYGLEFKASIWNYVNPVVSYLFLFVVLDLKSSLRLSMDQMYSKKSSLVWRKGKETLRIWINGRILYVIIYFHPRLPGNPVISVCMPVMARKAPKTLRKGILYDQEKCSPKSMREEALFLFSLSVLLPLGSRGRHSYRKHNCNYRKIAL